MASDRSSGIAQLSSNTDDHGCCILARYATYGFCDQADRERLQIGDARVIMPYALVDMEGSGAFELTMWPERFPTLLKPNPYPFEQPEFDLSSPALDDTNVPLNVTGNRAFMQIDSSGVACANWTLGRVNLGINTDPRMVITGR